MLVCSFCRRVWDCTLNADVRLLRTACRRFITILRAKVMLDLKRRARRGAVQLANIPAPKKAVRNATVFDDLVEETDKLVRALSVVVVPVPSCVLSLSITVAGSCGGMCHITGVVTGRNGRLRAEQDCGGDAGRLPEGAAPESGCDRPLLGRGHCGCNRRT